MTVYVGNNVSRNQTTMPTRSNYIHILTFISIICILCCSRFYLEVLRYTSPLDLCTTTWAPEHPYATQYAFRYILILQVSMGALHSNTLPVWMSPGAHNIIYLLHLGIKPLMHCHVGDNMLHNLTTMDTRPRYIHLLIFLYLLCVFYIVTGFLLYCHFSRKLWTSVP